MILKLISDLDILHLCNQIQSTMSQRPSHLIKVKCRVCKKPLKHKNYKDHLKQVHPDEDENNLQAATDQSISSFFSSGGPNPKRGRLDGAGGGQVSRHSPSPPRPRKSPAPQHLGTSPSDSEEDEKRVEEAAVSDHKEDEELSESDLFEEDEEVNSRSRGRFYSGESGVGSAGEEMNEEIDEEEGEENEVDVIDEIIEQHKNVIKRLENLKSKIVKRKTSVKAGGPRLRQLGVDAGGPGEGSQHPGPGGGAAGGGGGAGRVRGGGGGRGGPDLQPRLGLHRQSSGQVHLQDPREEERQSGGQVHLQVPREVERQSGGQVHLPGPREEEVRLHEVRLTASRSMKELKDLGYLVFAEEMIVKCPSCPNSQFKINEECLVEFQDEDNLPSVFVYLKKSLKRHIKSETHTTNTELLIKKTEETVRVLSLNRKAGITCGRVAYHNLQRGRPVRDYEEDLLILKMSGAKIG